MLIPVRQLSRTLRRSPASAAAAIVTLALTLGAGTSILAVIDAVLLTPPPFADPDALVTLGETPLDDMNSAPRAVSYERFEAWRDRAGSLAHLEAIDGTNLTLTELGAAERVNASDVTPGFLPLLGTTPAIGRSFASEDFGRPVVIVSYTFWRAKLGADPHVIGRSIVLGGQSHSIVGVLPQGFAYELGPSDIWRPLPFTSLQTRAAYRVGIVARLASHTSRSSLAGALGDVSHASVPPARVVVTPVTTAIAGGATKMLGLLIGAAAVAIAIAFTNFAGLLIVRSIGRRRELAIRSALGAPRSEIGKQMLVEAHALVAIGTLGGIAIAAWMTPAVAGLVLAQFGGVAGRNVALGGRAIAAAVVAASICACTSVFVAGLAASRSSVLDVLRHGAMARGSDLFWRRVFVICEVALAFVLLACVTLLGTNFVRWLEVNPGFAARGVLALQLSVPTAKYTPEQTVRFYSALQMALDERIGQRTVAIANELPLTGDGGRSLVGTRAGDTGHEAVIREATPYYFDVMRIPMVSGRGFQQSDNLSAPPRVVISESLAESLFASESPIGRRVWLMNAQMAEVIGVAGDVKHRALDESRSPTVYRSVLQASSRSNIIVVRSTRPDTDVIAAVRTEVGRLDRSVPVYGVRPLENVLAASPGMHTRRVLTSTFLAFAVLALLLGAIGLFGVIAHDVASRRKELGIRVALGARPSRIVVATAAPAAAMVACGLAAGGVLSIWAFGALNRLGFADGIDVLSLGVPAGMLALAGVAAALPPALRAASTDPLIALRSE
jgi:putative ABC transport system permease protein